MADLRMQKQSERFGSYVDVTDEFWGAALQIGYSHSSRLSFSVTAAQHTLPFSYNDFIRFWDHGALHPQGGTQSSTAPLFEGFVEEISPGEDTNEVRIVCYDPTHRADKMIQVMSEPWSEVEDSFPVPAPAAFPRVVYNTTIDNDDDFALALLLGADVGAIISLILNDQRKPLYHLNAGPGGDEPGEETQNFESGDMAALGTEPQGKFVAQSEPVRSLINRLLQQYEPAKKLHWTPGSRLWRVCDTMSATARTITVNDRTDTYGAVLTMQIVRSADGRYSAVEFFGPQDVEWREAVVELDEDGAPVGDHTLSVQSSGNIEVNEEDSGKICINGLTIIDPAFTRIARKGPYPIEVPGPGLFYRSSDGSIIANLVTSYVQSWGWSLQMRFDQSGSAYWQSIDGYFVDVRSGTIDLGGMCLFRLAAGPLGGEGSINLPSAIRFVYPATLGPLKVRYPESGHEGTLASVAGIENTWRIYDEDLAVYRSFGQSTTTETRLARFAELAEQMHAKVKDLVYAGGIMLDGLSYDFAFLNRRINLAGLDDNGEPIATGWESINAVVTDVEYDFEERTTTLQLNSDELEMVGIDPEQMKSSLKIRAAAPVFIFNWSMAYSYARTSRGGVGQNASLVVETGTIYLDEMGGIQ